MSFPEDIGKKEPIHAPCKHGAAGGRDGGGRIPDAGIPAKRRGGLSPSNASLIKKGSHHEASSASRGRVGGTITWV
jgi:hypothetical protein